jgi:hypothetical protein
MKIEILKQQLENKGYTLFRHCKDPENLKEIERIKTIQNILEKAKLEIEKLGGYADFPDYLHGQTNNYLTADDYTCDEIWQKDDNFVCIAYEEENNDYAGAIVNYKSKSKDNDLYNRKHGISFYFKNGILTSKMYYTVCDNEIGFNNSWNYNIQTIEIIDGKEKITYDRSSINGLEHIPLTTDYGFIPE